MAKTLGGEVRDQIAHTAVAWAFVTVVALAIGYFWAATLCMTLALIREVMQHHGFDLGWGSLLDLAFFAVGCALAIFIPW